MFDKTVVIDKKAILYIEQKRKKKITVSKKKQ